MRINSEQQQNSRVERKYQQLKLQFDTDIIIPDDDPVRVASAQLDELDYSNLYRAYSHIGRKPATEPRILFQVLVYGYMNGLYSSRKIEGACRKNIDFMWLLDGEPVPDHNTIARCRSGKLSEAIEDLFYQYVQKLAELHEINNEEVFIDGTKIESVSNRYKFVWRKTVERALEKVKSEAKKLLTENGVEGNATQSKLKTLVASLKPETVVSGTGHRKTAQQRQWEKASKLEEQWKNNEKKLRIMGEHRNSYAKTDHGATFMRMKEDHMRNGQLKPGYNIQIAVNSQYITGLDVFTNRTDSGTLIPFIKKLEEKQGQKYENIVADAGYESLENYSFLDKNGQTSYVKPINYEQKKTKKYREQIGRQENMLYDKVADCYICAEGRRLMFQRDSKEYSASGFEKTVSHYRCEDCAGCAQRLQCCKAKDIETPKELRVCREFDAYRVKSMQNITSAQGILLRTNRSIQVEGAFGVLKSNRKFHRFLLRGKIKVGIELFLLSLAYNIRKLFAKMQSATLGEHLFYPRNC